MRAAKTGPRAKDMSRNEDKGSRMAKIGAGDIPAVWLRGGGKGGEATELQHRD